MDTTGGDFNYDASTGVYVWDDDTQAWSQERPADSLILRFPTAPADTPRTNATFTLSRYEKESVTIGGSTEHVPTEIVASLSVEGTEVLTIDLGDVGFASLLGVPQSFSLNVTAPPLAYTTGLDPTQDGMYEYQDEFQNNGQLVTSTTSTVDVFSDDENSGSTLGSVEGKTQVGQDLVLEYTAEIGALPALEDPSADEINERVDVEVLLQGEQVATLRYDGSADQVIVVYSDDTTEPLSDLLRDLGAVGDLF